MNIIEIDKGVYLVPLDQDMPGFTDFIGAWVVKKENAAFLVDMGPSSTAPVLLAALKSLGITRLDAILITHIHMDHAGGVGDIAKHFPETPILCHHKGIEHLRDPSRLWEGSLKTLGEKAEKYGPILPVVSSPIVDAQGEFQKEGLSIQCIPTPGHAAHHVSFLFESLLFAGEVGGLHIDVDKQGDEKIGYLRPATPPRFFLETSVQSLDSVMDLPCDLLCYGHFGVVKKRSGILAAHREQLFLWRDIIREELEKQGDDPGILDGCLETLLKKDKLLEGFARLSPGVRERERYFLKNSIRGFLGYLSD